MKTIVIFTNHLYQYKVNCFKKIPPINFLRAFEPCHTNKLHLVFPHQPNVFELIDFTRWFGDVIFRRIANILSRFTLVNNIDFKINY